MAKETLLSIVIVSYNNQQVLFDCLDSIEKNNDVGEALQVIVVEQSDSDTIYQELVRRYPGVRAIRASNKGFGAGNNAGFHEAKGKYVLFLNPDTVIPSPIFQRAISEFESNDRLGLFGGRLLDAQGGKNQSFYFRNPIGLFRGYVWRICNKLDIFLPNIMYITGADMFFRSDVFEKVGGFDERMFMYFEEPDLCNRVQAAGYEIKFVPDISIVHLEGKSGADSERSFGFKLDSLEIYCQKNNLSYSAMLKRWTRVLAIKSALGHDASTAHAQRELIEGRLNQRSDREQL